MKNLYIKRFNELSTIQLYKILQARVNVFVVEQKCAYPEIDGKDVDAWHVFYEDDKGDISAYLRLYFKYDESDTIQIGRVLTIKRGAGLGEELLKSAAAFAKENLHARALFCEAQSYAVDFYRKIGLEVSSEEFSEDGIPHVEMRRVL